VTDLRDEGTGYLAPPRQIRRSDDRRNEELSKEVAPVINMVKDYPFKLDFAKYAGNYSEKDGYSSVINNSAYP
jgi:hypothetical protein